VEFISVTQQALLYHITLSFHEKYQKIKNMGHKFAMVLRFRAACSPRVWDLWANGR